MNESTYVVRKSSEVIEHWMNEGRTGEQEKISGGRKVSLGKIN